MFTWLNRWMTSYRYNVKRDGLPPFEVTLHAVNARGAAVKAAEIGKTLGLLLVGPL